MPFTPKAKYNKFPLRPPGSNALAAALGAVAHLSPRPANNNWPPTEQHRHFPFGIPYPDPAKEFEYLYRRFTEAEAKCRLQKLSSPK